MRHGASDDPEYDPSTLQLPSSFPKLRDANGAQWTVSPGQTQWWRFKAQNFDSVLLFKMGKFYEMYEMDAHIGVRELGLMYMRGEQPHAGFPEKNYAKHAEQLARNGHRVVCIEQTETPAQLAERKKRDKTCKDTVVRREMVQVLTQGTMVDTGMLNSSPDAAYVCCVVDGGEEKDGGGWIGLCAADCGTGRFLVGAWRDDDGASCLRTALAEIRPVEILTPPSGLAARVKMATDVMCARANHRTFRTTSATEAIQDAEAEGYFKAFKNGFPDAIKELRDTACDPMRADSARGALSSRTCAPHSSTPISFRRVESNPCTRRMLGTRASVSRDGHMPRTSPWTPPRCRAWKFWRTPPAAPRERS